jgi:hypothetical protein
VADAPSGSVLRPWQFFGLIGVVGLSVAVFALRITAVSDVVLIGLAIAAAAAVALGVLETLLPLAGADRRETVPGGRLRAALEHERFLVVRSIRDLEFDRAMGKVADGDFEEIITRLRARALRLSKQLEGGGTGYRESIERELASRLARTRGADVEARAPETGRAAAEAPAAPVPGAASASTCPGCGAPRDQGARFCRDCGARLLAVVLAALCCAVPLRAQPQMQMPNVGQMSGIPRPVDNLPDGSISVRLVRGDLSHNLVAHPVQLRADGRLQTANTDADGRAEFSGVAPGTPVTVIAVVEGERLESEEFAAPQKGGVRVLLVAGSSGGGGEAAVGARPGSVAFGGDTRIVVDFGEDGLVVYYLLDIANNRQEAVSPESPIVLEMPDGAQGTSLMEESPGVSIRGRRVTLTGPFKPGHTRVSLTYGLPYSVAAMSIIQPMPVALESPTVMMRKLGDANMTSPQLSGRQDGQFGGHSYLVSVGPTVVAGAALRLDLTGLPHYSRGPWVTTFALAGLVFSVGLWGAFRSRPGAVSGARVRELRERREKAFGDLVRLEEQRRAGAMDASRYEARRTALITRLERIYGELEAEGGDEGLAA